MAEAEAKGELVHAEVVTQTLPDVPIPTRGKRPENIQRAMTKSVDTMTILKGINNALTPEEVEALLHEAIGYARQWKSWEGIEKLLRLVLEYTVGKPIQRSVSAQITPEKFAEWLADTPPQDE